MRDAQGEHGHVVVAIAGVLVGQHVHEVDQGKVDVGDGNDGEAFQALLDRSVAVFDEPVGEEDHGGVCGQGVGVVVARLGGVDAEGQVGAGGR